MRANAHQVEIASWLFSIVLISFKWCYIIISDPEHQLFNKYIHIQVTILHSLWNFFHNFTVSHADDITIMLLLYVSNAAMERYEIAETLPAAGLQDKLLKLV